MDPFLSGDGVLVSWYNETYYNLHCSVSMCAPRSSCGISSEEHQRRKQNPDEFLFYAIVVEVVVLNDDTQLV